MAVTGLGQYAALFDTQTGNVSIRGLVPTQDAELTRKDYVDGGLTSLLDIVTGLTMRPVGAAELGWNPNGVLVGAWLQTSSVNGVPMWERQS